ncbi:hypothetical protein Tco_1296146 [Tanacetum coccineum]
MKRGYARDFVPLLPAMLAGAAVDQGEGSTQPAEPHHTPVDPISSISQLPISSPPHPSPSISSPPHLLPPLPLPPHPSPPLPSPPHPSPPHQSPPFHYLITHHLGPMKNLSLKLVTRIETLETELQQTKTTYGKVVLTLVKKDIDDDPLVSLVRESMKMKEKSTDFVTTTKASGEDQEEDISPTILEAAKTLSKVASQVVSKVKSTNKGKRYRRRARSVAKNINIGLDAKEEINIGRVEINTGIEEVSTGSAKVDSGTASKRGQRERKAPMVEEDIQATHKTKEQIREEEAGFEEAIKLQAQMDEEVAKQIHLDEMIAKRMAKKEALSEQQKKRKDQVQFEA